MTAAALIEAMSWCCPKCQLVYVSAFPIHGVSHGCPKANGRQVEYMPLVTP